MNRAFSVFANGGFLIEPYLIEAVYNQDGAAVYYHQPQLACDHCAAEAPEVKEQVETEEVLTSNITSPASDLTITGRNSQQITPADWNNKNRQPVAVQQPEAIQAPRIISAENPFIIASFMQDVINRGTGVRAKSLNRSDLAGKTGTTNDQLDGWFNGYQPQAVTNVWVGFDTPEPMGRGEVGGRVALPIWMDYMAVALADVPEQQRAIPAGVISARIDLDSGQLLPPESQGGRVEYYKVGRLPPAKDTQKQVDYDDLF